jgi:hypothetical protein
MGFRVGVLVGTVESCDRTPRQSSEVSQIDLLAQRKRLAPFRDSFEVLRGHIEVDSLWLTAWPLHDSDMTPILRRRFQHQGGDSRAMTGKLAR